MDRRNRLGILIKNMESSDFVPSVKLDNSEVVLLVAKLLDWRSRSPAGSYRDRKYQQHLSHSPGQSSRVEQRHY